MSLDYELRILQTTDILTSIMVSSERGLMSTLTGDVEL